MAALDDGEGLTPFLLRTMTVPLEFGDTLAVRLAVPFPFVIVGAARLPFAVGGGGRVEFDC